MLLKAGSSISNRMKSARIGMIIGQVMSKVMEVDIIAKDLS